MKTKRKVISVSISEIANDFLSKLAKKQKKTKSGLIPSFIEAEMRKDLNIDPMTEKLYKLLHKTSNAMSSLANKDEAPEEAILKAFTKSYGILIDIHLEQQHINKRLGELSK